jgi:hypothetical protein
MLTQEPLLNSFVTYLSETVRQIMGSSGREMTINFSQKQLLDVRQVFADMLLRGERKLHLFSELISKEYVGDYQLSSVVYGEIERSHERFVLTQNISRHDLYSTTDIDLGNRQLSKLRFFQSDGWVKAGLVANVVEYQPIAINEFRIQKIISRIKAEEEIWNKVTDEIFDLDSLIKRDKQMSHLSFFVKDVFGLKIVVGDARDVDPLQRTLSSKSFSDSSRTTLGIPLEKSTEMLEILEVKDYSGHESKKQSGWGAVKSVVSWWGKTIEIQIIPLNTYLHEREYLTKESHAGFRSRREELRTLVTNDYPLYGFMRHLLQWLFLDGNNPAKTPQFPRIKIQMNP